MHKKILGTEVSHEILTENKVSFNVPKELEGQKEELKDYIKIYNPVEMVKQITGRRWSKNIIIEHKADLGQNAAMDKKRKAILLNFDNDLYYRWVSICHEFAHFILENRPAWYENKEIQTIITKNKNWISQKYHYTFRGAIEQTLAFFIQAACENQAGQPRKLEDCELWKKTFEHAEILNFAETLWDDWLEYLNKTDEYHRIDDWILEMLKKHYDK